MNGYEVAPESLGERVKTLTRLAELTGELIATATRLAERQPLLGTAPPARELAGRLSAAAGESGLTGEVTAAEREVREFQRVLAAITTTYVDVDQQRVGR
ncbi:hypothetical protein BBK82_32290 [Lentzea guizhouensis]|uniref:PE domain-containing protein n=1 Tax=Lentzea guizhouensis TaxID=1586287 RepID=A0A1B2HQL5_9PSEU|nr:hypothetical protein [Lentzea guizhouensis]ANZ40026.1 hypothetical protein BBK82_32290 [Lentzea guizhouensis]